jgi:hypothetical protein
VSDVRDGRHSDADPDGDTYTHTHVDADANSDPDLDSYTDAYADTIPKVRELDGVRLRR